MKTIPFGVECLCALAIAVASSLTFHLEAAETSLTMSSEPGDYIGGGQHYFFTPAGGTFGSNGNTNYVGISFSGAGHFWSLDFAPIRGQALQPGNYVGATRFPSPNQPGLSVDGDGRGCNTLTGGFRIKQISFGAGTAVNSFWATFEQHCEGVVPALTGDIRFNANVTVAVSAPFSSTVERGQTLTFQVSATDSGSRQVMLSATNLPTGATFTDNGNSTGTFLWVVGRGQTGTYQVTFLGDNGAGGRDYTLTDIHVVGYTSLTMSSDPGDYIGGGRQYTYTLQDSAISVARNYDSGVSVSFGGWNLDFAAPFGQPLMTGVYTGAMRWPFQDDNRAGLDVFGQGRGCNKVTGAFTVRQLEYDHSGTVQSFWATFEQHCEGMVPALRGELRFNADVFISVQAPSRLRANMGDTLTFDVRATNVSAAPVALSAVNLPSGATFTDHGDNTASFQWQPDQPGVQTITFFGRDSSGEAGHATTLVQVPGPTVLIMDSDDGDYIGAGQSYFFTPQDGSFSISGNASAISIYFSGSSHDLSLDFAAPSGQQLGPGSYVGAARFQSATQPGLNIFGDGRGCNVITGQFTVREISFNPGNSVASFWATFEQHCEGATPALRGEVRYNAGRPAAATLSGTTWGGGNFSFSFPTQPGHNYDVQYTSAIGNGGWQSLTNLPGTGTLLNITDRNPPSTQRFYRVIAQ